MALNDPYKTDIAFNGDFVVTATGDLDVVSGLQNVRQALLRRIMTRKGAIVHRPDYGCGLIDMQNAPMTLAAQRQLATRIAEQFPRDPRVIAIKSLSVTAADNRPDFVRVVVTVDVVGIGEVQLTFTPFQEVAI